MNGEGNPANELLERAALAKHALGEMLYPLAECTVDGNRALWLSIELTWLARRLKLIAAQAPDRCATLQADSQDAGSELYILPGFRVLVVGDSDRLPESTRDELADAEVIRLATESALSTVADHAPYDRILVTEPTRAVAWAWVQHTRPGGLVLCLLDPTGAAAQPVLLRCEDDRAMGRFVVPGRGLDSPAIDITISPIQPSLVDPASRHGRTRLPLRVWELGVPWFLATATMPDGLTLSGVSGTDGGFRLSTNDGSWCEITSMRGDDYRYVAEGGPMDLFAHLASTHRQWHDLGRPGWERFTLLVTLTEHVIGLVGSHARWLLPE